MININQLVDRSGNPFESTIERRARALAPVDEVALILREATQSVEDQLRIEDAGWVSLTGFGGAIALDRIENLKLSRLYYTKDPLGKQSIRLWTDYTFGSGMVWSSPEDSTTKVLKAFWNSPDNKSVLSARGQRKISDKLLVDGEIFFALFRGSGGKVKIRTIDPLEITEIITNPDDIEDVLFYRRTWADAQGQPHNTLYRSTTNTKNKATVDSQGKGVSATDDAVVYHMTYNTITQRGNPLLLPALDWIKQYRRFLASRVAIMLSLARFAWLQKVQGNQAQVEAQKAKTEGQEINAGSILLENMGSSTTPIKTDSNASGAYQDGKMLKHQVFAAVGIPEQYFGDISTGNLATAKTVELPMMKMFQSYQKVWADTFQDLDEIVLAWNNIKPDKWYVDRVFPPITPQDVQQAAEAMVKIIGIFPEFAESEDVQQLALVTMGINDPAEVLEELEKMEESNPNIRVLRAIRKMKEIVTRKERVNEATTNA